MRSLRYTCNERISLCCLAACFFVPGVASSHPTRSACRLFRTIGDVVIMYVTLLSLSLSLSDGIILFRSDSAHYEKTKSKKLAEIMYSSCGYKTAQHTEEILNRYEKKFEQYKKHLVFLSWDWKSQKRENVIRSEIYYCTFQNQAPMLKARFILKGF